MRPSSGGRKAAAHGNGARFAPYISFAVRLRLVIALPKPSARKPWLTRRTTAARSHRKTGCERAPPTLVPDRQAVFVPVVQLDAVATPGAKHEQIPHGGSWPNCCCTSLTAHSLVGPTICEHHCESRELLLPRRRSVDGGTSCTTGAIIVKSRAGHFDIMAINDAINHLEKAVEDLSCFRPKSGGGAGRPDRA